MRLVLNICCLMSYIAVLSCSGSHIAEHKKINIKRFDKELLTAIKCDTVKTDSLKTVYSSILKIYATGIIRCSSPEDSVHEIISALKNIYYTTKEFQQLYEYTEKKYSDLNDIEENISTGFGYYTSLFPNCTTPEIFTHISGFSQSIITADSILSISLDNYLGEEYSGYNGVFFDYQLKNKKRNRIAQDVFTVCLYNDFPYEIKNKPLIKGIIYEGSIIYAIKQILPNNNISGLMNYSKEQTNWCINNENKIWTYIVKSGHLYSTDHLIYSKYLNEAPYTPFFGKESPDRLGKWLGYRIIEKYMKNPNKKSTLTDILSDKYSVTEILESSDFGN